MLNIKKAFYLLPFAFYLSSCSFNPPVQGKGEAYLQGEWEQDSLAGEKQLVTYSAQYFKFDCDSFYITINTVSQINYGADTCMNTGRWTEYIKGPYQQQNDTLHLKGFFCNADKSLKEQNTCFRTGVYEEFFNVKKQSDSLLQLSGASSVTTINVRLIKRTTCRPKPLI